VLATEVISSGIKGQKLIIPLAFIFDTYFMSRVNGKLKF
jgi:hypothetical protein